MQHMREEILIEAPIDHVWKFLSDTSRSHDWMPRMEFTEFSGPIDKVGTTYLSTGKMMGFEVKQKYTVVEVEPPKFFHQHSPDQGGADDYFKLESEGDKTRFIIESEWEMPAHVPGFLKNLMTTSFFERTARNMLQDFKMLAEATAPVPA
jgi:uncharacterized protein YndB with AHSA1/START domain